jgi:hypothetical protein
LQDELAEIDASNNLTRKREVIERYVRKITVETQQLGPRKLQADVRVFLRLKPETIAVAGVTHWPGGWLCRRSVSTYRSGASTVVSG